MIGNSRMVQVKKIVPKEESTEQAINELSRATTTTGERSVTVKEKPEFISPLNDPVKRIRLKRFGQYITPENSPVSPERFRGYHTGVDFEVFPEELNGTVEVKAFCTGPLIQKQWVSGYGGIAVQACKINNADVIVLYGHLNLLSIDIAVNKEVKAGEIIGYLGADHSQETDRERKHLHFSIHKGKAINYKGYVSSETALNDWLDPCDYICDMPLY